MFLYTSTKKQTAISDRPFIWVMIKTLFINCHKQSLIYFVYKYLYYNNAGAKVILINLYAAAVQNCVNPMQYIVVPDLHYDF